MTKIQQRLLAASILIAGLGLCLPLYKQIYRQYIQCDRKHIKAELEMPTKAIDRSKDREISFARPPQELADNVEVILVSGYESDNLGSENIVKVNINRPNKNVLLVLSSYDRVNWQLEASPTTNITGVLISSYSPSTVINIDSAKVFDVELPYSYEIENENFVGVLKQLNQWFAIDRVDAFRGQYSLPNEISISQLDPIDPALTLAGYPVQEPTNNFEFTLYDDNYAPVKWTLKGAEEKSDRLVRQTGIAVSPDGKEYELTDTGIKVTNCNSKQKEFKIPSKFPKLSWGTDIAYDSKRDIVSLVSLGGEGYFYRFDAKQRRWLDVRSLNNLDLKSLTYDRTSDRYIAWGEDYLNMDDLLFISGTGKLLSTESISDRLTGFYRQYDRGNESSPVVEIAANGNNLALMTYEGNSIQSIWHYDMDLKDIRLTYKSN